WPGNVRQLENDCRWLTVMSPADEIVIDDLPPAARSATVADAASVTIRDTASVPDAAEWDTVLADWVGRRLAAGDARLLDEAMPRFERTVIRAALAATGGRRQEAAQLLGWGRNTLTRKIKALGIDTGGNS